MPTETLALTLPSGAAALLARPSSTAPVTKAVLLIHGWNGDMGEHGGLFAHLAPALAASGIASIRFNVTGEGSRSGFEVTSTVESRKAEAESAWNALQQHFPDVRGGILGLSLGAFTAMTTTAAHPDWFRSMVLWSGVSDMNGTGNPVYRTALRDALHSGRGVYKEHRRIVLTKAFAESYVGLDAADNLASYNGALLTVRCEDDYAPNKDREWLGLTPSTDKASLLIGGGSHMFNARDNDQDMPPVAMRAIEATVSWFERTLSP